MANIAGKKAELADLDASWGDEALGSGQLEQALKCWEEVQSIKEGSRYLEAEARLASIYPRYADALIAEDKYPEALAVLNKLNTTVQNPANYIRAAEIYEKLGQPAAAIEEFRAASRLNPNVVPSDKMANLMVKYGKELLDEGNTDAGYGYLQQAKGLDSTLMVPSMVLRNVHITADKFPALSGEVFNAGNDAISEIKLEAYLVDLSSSQTLWQQTKNIINEYAPALAPRDSRPFEFKPQLKAGVNNANIAFDVYINGQLYKSYPLTKNTTAAVPSPVLLDTGLNNKINAISNMQTPSNNQQLLPAPSSARKKTIELIPNVDFTPRRNANQDLQEQSTPEDQTLKDLSR
jgi:tetratricopeptide (TPR) repeat protein